MRIRCYKNNIEIATTIKLESTILKFLCYKILVLLEPLSLNAIYSNS